MLNKLRSLVFGLEEYQKTKIDVRFQLTSEIIHKIKINSITDFEILESCIYKIKDQLRVTSSNLNKVIRNSQNSLTKQVVQTMLNQLLKIRDVFLKRAFSAIETVEPEFFEQQVSSEHEEHEDLSKNIDTKKIKIEPEPKQVNTSNEKDKEIFKTAEFTVTLHAKSTPYLIIDFKDTVSFKVLKEFSILLFDITKCSGTSILVESKKAMIVARNQDDNALEILPQEINENLEEVFNSLIKGQKHFGENGEKTTKDIEFKEIDEVKPSIQTKKKNEESLDELLFSAESTHSNFGKKPNPKKDDSTLDFEKDEPISIEKKPAKVEIEKNRIDTYVQESSEGDKEKDVPRNEIKKEEVEIKEEKLEVPKTSKIPEKKEEKKVEPILSSEPSQVVSSTPNLYEVYRDEQIMVYLDTKSSILGHLIVEDIQKRPFSKLPDNQVSYMMLFSKVFTSLVFEVLQAHGTSIQWEYNSSSLEIIPRFQDDKALTVANGGEVDPLELENISKQLLQKMQNEIATQSEVKPQAKVELSEDELKKKAEYVLKALKKIP